MRRRGRLVTRGLGRGAWAMVDGLAWMGCIVLATWVRYDFNIPESATPAMVTIAIGAAVLHLEIGAIAGPYAIGHERGSFEEVVELARATAITTAAVFVAVAVLRPDGYPRTVPFGAGAFALALMLALRFALRAWRQKRAGARHAGRRVIVFGAGEGGRQLLRAMLRDASSPYLPVAVVDDDPHKNHMRLEGVKVHAGRNALGRLATQHGAEVLAIAVPSADAALIRDLSDRADAAGLDVLVLPPVSEIFGGRPGPADLRDLDLGDLLGRRPVTLDSTAIAGQLSGRRVLVTGAGGSIGSELCRQIARFGPARLFMLDRDESGLHGAALTVTGDGLLDNDDVILADIRDLEALRSVFRTAAPEIIFHAAALKHLPLLETYPLEAWKSNVVGTLNVLTAAAEVGVEAFLNISTDKAADPTCVLGYSKRIAERLTAGFAQDHPGRYVSVRFGNVLGSRGSVVHAFTAQIGRGGPVTVTHPDVERYFMLIPEACQLVLEASSIGNDGEVLVLDMGEQVKIVDVAKTLIRLSGRTDIEIVYTGLRPGEKLAERRFSRTEVATTTAHELVSTVPVPTLAGIEVTRQTLASHADAADWMRAESSPARARSPRASAA